MIGRTEHFRMARRRWYTVSFGGETISKLNFFFWHQFHVSHVMSCWWRTIWVKNLPFVIFCCRLKVKNLTLTLIYKAWHYVNFYGVIRVVVSKKTIKNWWSEYDIVKTRECKSTVVSRKPIGRNIQFRSSIWDQNLEKQLLGAILLIVETIAPLNCEPARDKF